MLRDHDNIIKNLRQEVNLLKDLTANHDKLHKEEKKSIDTLNKAIEDRKFLSVNYL